MKTRYPSSLQPWQPSLQTGREADEANKSTKPGPSENAHRPAGAATCSAPARSSEKATNILRREDNSPATGS